MSEINKVNVNHPVKTGEVLIENVLGLKVNIVVTTDLWRVLIDG